MQYEAKGPTHGDLSQQDQRQGVKEGVKVLASVVLSWTSYTLKQLDFLQAFDLLKLLSQLVKQLRKLGDRNSFFAQLCLHFAYFYLRDRKHNAALDCVTRGIAAEEKARSSEWRVHLYSMAGYACSQKADHRKAVLAYQQALKCFGSEKVALTYSSESLWQAAVWYNLAVEHSNMHLRVDSVYYIEQAAGLAARVPYTAQLHPRIANLFRELTGSIPAGISQAPSTAFNFMPGGQILDQRTKHVEVRMESPLSRRLKSGGERKKKPSLKELRSEERTVKHRPIDESSKEAAPIRNVKSRDSVPHLEGLNKRGSRKRITTDLILKQDTSRRVQNFREQITQARSTEVSVQRTRDRLPTAASAVEGALLGYKSRTEFEDFQRSARQQRSEVQSLIRGRLARLTHASDIKEKALVGLQAAIRRRLALRDYVLHERSVTVIQQTWKQHRTLQHKHKLASVLQRVVRGKLVRLDFHEVGRKLQALVQSSEAALKALVLESLIWFDQSVQADRALRETFKRLSQAYLAVKTKEQMRQFVEETRRSRIRVKFYEDNKSQVDFIQRVWRGCAVRSLMLREVAAARKLQGWTRSRLRRPK
jgi:hypothetical protein